ncbi:MAG TPA: hypothetical protein VED00_02310 [archaeon]|nr:hypothetical protein [archaeon]
MSESINQVTLTLGLLVTFAGVFLAFTLDRAIDRIKRIQAKNELLKNLACELSELKKNLTGDAYRLYPDIWDSAVASGQLELLTSEQVTNLANVYRKIKGTDYEAIRVRDAREAYMMRAPNPYTNLEENWTDLSKRHLVRMEETKALIDEILKEPWLSRYVEKS